jgi:E3 ubiquitin-protein ligase MGRN1
MGMAESSEINRSYSSEETAQNRQLLNELYRSNSEYRYYYLNQGYNTGLSILPPRPLPISRINTTSCIDTLSNIEYESAKLVQETGNPNLYWLSFRYNTSVPATLKIHFFAIEITNRKKDTLYFHVNTRKYPPSQEFKIEPGLNIEFPSRKVYIDTSVYTYDELTFRDRQTYPIVIEICTDLEGNRQSYAAYLSLATKEETWFLREMKHKLTINSKSYNLFTIYGEQREPESPSTCIICMTEKINTTVMPCKHFCLCSICADTMREQSRSKCPICRASVESLLTIKND